MIKRVILVSIIVFIIAFVGFFLLTVAMERKANIDRTQLILEDETMLVQTQGNILSYEVNRFVNDLEFAAQIFSVYSNDGKGYDTVADIWKSFSDTEMIYDQIRYIDENGDERIRVNYNPEGPVIVEEQQLQNKKDRYYFTDSFRLDEGQIYISKLDLNIENGEIEQPIKPMIRIATPVLNDTGEKNGIIIINYCAKNLINNFNNISKASENSVYLLNNDGYWLSNSDDESAEWAFMYEDKQDIRLDSFYPQEWEQILKTRSGNINSDNGVFIYKHVWFSDEGNSNIVTGEGSWIVLSYISPDDVFSQGIITSFWSNAVYILKKRTFNVYFTDYNICNVGCPYINTLQNGQAPQVFLGIRQYDKGL